MEVAYDDIGTMLCGGGLDSGSKWGQPSLPEPAFGVELGSN